jgi:hypothetical protein
MLPVLLGSVYAEYDALGPIGMQNRMFGSCADRIRVFFLLLLVSICACVRQPVSSPVCPSVRLSVRTSARRTHLLPALQGLGFRVNETLNRSPSARPCVAPTCCLLWRV